jgi:ribonuclease E
MLDEHADTPATPDSGAPDAADSSATQATATKAASKTTKKSSQKTSQKTGQKTGHQATKKTTKQPAKKAAAKGADAPAVAKKATAKRTSKKAAATAESGAQIQVAGAGDAGSSQQAPRKRTSAEATKEPATKAAKKATGKATGKATKKATKKSADQPADQPAPDTASTETADRPSVAPLFQAPEPTAPRTRRTRKAAETTTDGDAPVEAPAEESSTAAEGDEDGESTARRRRRRGGRRRRKSGGEGDGGQAEQADGDEESAASTEAAATDAAEPAESGSSSRRRRRRRRAGDEDSEGSDDPTNTVTKVRSGRSAADEITAVTGSTRLEAKKQRRREGREAGRRRAPIVSEAEFLARRESVNRVMVIRQRDDVTQIGVLEDNVLVEHYVARESQTSLIGNVYLGRVQNVLPSMEAAFIDIGKGRNAVLYAGEVNWSALGHKDGQPRKIESVLSSGQSVLVQVTKDPIGHKGARLTSQISLAGRFLVYVPDGTTSGISRKLPDTERNRLKNLLKDIVPESAGVIVRTAAEGAAEDELTRDVERLKARWEDIEKKAKGSAPQLLYGEPDLTLKVVRDLFTEDFTKLVIEGDEAWDTVQGYVAHVAPDLEDRLERYQPKKDQDVFSAYRIDEQIKKGLDRKVWLPSGGSLIIDRTEAMTVIDVNTGKFTGSGGNLEETVTKNNLEAAEEIVRQLRLRDIGGIIVVDFIDMVLESNRDLVLRRLVECLGRDRTRHQVAEVTSLGLVQMTRKRIGTGLLESFSHDCPTCHGRGVVVEDAPVEPKKAEEEPRRTRRSRGRGRAESGNGNGDATPARSAAPSPKDIAAMARHHTDSPADEADDLVDLTADHSPAEATEQPDEVAEIGVEQPAAVERADEPEASEEPAPEPAPEPEPEPAPDTTPEPAPEAPSEPVAEAAAPATPPEPAKPTVATRTRRRAASRPAGPPSPVAAGGDGAGSAETEPAEVATGPGEEAASLHVPVKRKGARKR